MAITTTTHLNFRGDARAATGSPGEGGGGDRRRGEPGRRGCEPGRVRGADAAVPPAAGRARSCPAFRSPARVGICSNDAR